MANLTLIGDDVATLRPTFEGVRGQLGLVPNPFRVVANSPAALRGRIALTVAEANGCGYCLSAHAALGAGAGLSEADIEGARAGRAPAAHVALNVFTNTVNNVAETPIDFPVRTPLARAA